MARINYIVFVVLAIAGTNWYHIVLKPCAQSLQRKYADVIDTGFVTLGDGCYHVFIDAGSNRGVHGRFLFEPEKYPLSFFAGRLKDLFGLNRTLQNICVFAFEPNPKHMGSQSITESSYRRMGWRYHYLPFGLSDEDGNLTFYRNPVLNCGGHCEEWGFSIVAASASNESEAVVVNVLNLSSWVQRNILKRKIPFRNSFNSLSPSLVMKMDIEGSEYKVLTSLLESGVSHDFDHILGEFHSKHNHIRIEGIVDLENNLS